MLTADSARELSGVSFGFTFGAPIPTIPAPQFEPTEIVVKRTSPRKSLCHVGILTNSTAPLENKLAPLENTTALGKQSSNDADPGPQNSTAVSYTHLTLPTKRIV